jgi:vacuolar-type H+-ATPase subunit E/Vma4
MAKNVGDDAKMQALVSQQDAKELKDLMLEKTNKALADSLEIKVDRGISKGFRIGKKGEDVYYDFTDESITDFLREFLNPSIKKMLSE